MKVYAPGLCVPLYKWHTDTGDPYFVGIPLNGEWIDVPDYFRQVTKGKPENSVIHAKVVASGGIPITVAAMTNPSWGVCPNTIDGSPGGSSRIFQPGGVETVHVGKVVTLEEVYRFPNYKGRKPVVARKCQVPIYHTAACQTSARLAVGNYYMQMNFEVRVITERRERSDGSNQYRVAAVRAWTEGKDRHWKKNHPIPSLGPLHDALEACRKAVISAYPQEQRKWTEDEKRSAAELVTSTFAKFAYEVAKAPGVTGGEWITPVEVSSMPPQVPKRLRNAFLLNEEMFLGERTDPVFKGRSAALPNYWRGWLVQHALLEACESFPKLNDNSIQNIMEIAGFIKALVVDHKIEIPRSLNDAWLAYRYQYSTTKMDVEEAIKFVHRRMDLGDLGKGITCYGSSQCTFKGTTIHCQCSIDISAKNVGYLARLWRALDQYGLTVDFYVIWDSLPYSFMVDWFLPIGNLAVVMDASYKYFSGEYYELGRPVYSLSYTRELPLADANHARANVKCYSRWVGSVPRSLYSYYWFDTPSSSSKTVWYRVLDAVSMFVGRA